MKRIGLLGGTFNPVHLGHLSIAQIACEKLKLDKIIFIPSYQPPHKIISNVIPAKDRLNMVKLAIAGNPKFDVSDFEIKKGGKSYSIDVIEYFYNRYPKNVKFFFIIGDDSVSTLHKWKRIEDITKIVAFVAINRLGFQSKKSSIKMKKFTMLNLGISSSYIRRCVSNNRSIKYLVPDNVVKYIKRKKIYSK